MTSNEPQIADNSKFTAKETCCILECSMSSLRNYVNQGLIRFGISKRNNRRFYTGFEIKKFWKTQF